MIMNYVGFDIGKKSIRFIQDHEIVFDEYACLAFNNQNKVIAIGKEALDLIGERRVVYYRSFDELFTYLDTVLEKFHVFRLFHKTGIAFTTPSNFTEEDNKKIYNYFYHRGASKVVYEPENWCAALGSHLQITLPVSACLLHIGYSHSSLTLFYENKIKKEMIYSLGSVHIDSQIKNWIQNTYHFQISDSACEDIKTKIGQCLTVNHPKSIRIPGTDFVSQQMKYLELNENHIVPIIQTLIYDWSKWIYEFLSSLDLKEQEEIYNRGILCSGPTSLIPNLCTCFQQQLGIPFSLSFHANQSTSIGLIEIINQIDK